MRQFKIQTIKWWVDMGLNKDEMILLKQLLNNLDNSQKENLINELSNEIRTNKYRKINLSIYKKDKGIAEECPHCHSKHIIKKGKYKNRQRYKCKDCNKFYKDTSNTILHKTRKDLNTWTEYIKCFIDKRPLREITEICDISLPTAHDWRIKMTDILLKMTDNIKLNGIVESDETYTRLSFKGNHSKSKNFVMPREVHKKGFPR